MGRRGLHLRRQFARQRDHQSDDRSRAVVIGVQRLMVHPRCVHAPMVQQRSHSCQADTLPTLTWTWLVTFYTQNALGRGSFLTSGWLMIIF